MRRGSNAKDGDKKKKKPLTNHEKAVFFVDKLQATIQGEIEKGTIEISKNKRHVSPPQTKVELSLQNIEQNLSQIRASIIEQKKQQQEIDKVKLAQAKEFITKMKKDKQSHQLRMRESEQKREMAYAKIFSDTAMERMRRKLEERVQLKKMEIEERIKEMSDKKHQREKTVSGQQIQYSQFVKGIKSKSSTKLPSIANPQKEERNHSVLMMRDHKNSLSTIKKQQFSNKSNKNIDLFIQKQKLKDEGSRLKYLQLGNQSLLSKMRSNHLIFINKLEKSNKEKHEDVGFLGNKSKIYGNQYLKESLLRIKKPSEPETANQPIHNKNKSQLQVQSHEAQINKNDKLQNLKENWFKVLSRIQHFEITEQQGIELLHSIQKKLDKIYSKGIPQRLKKKLQIFAKLHPPQPQNHSQIII